MLGWGGGEGGSVGERRRWEGIVGLGEGGGEQGLCVEME